jgi:hypothetical protein
VFLLLLLLLIIIIFMGRKIMGDELDEICSAHARNNNAYKIFVRKSTKQFGIRSQINLKET